MRDSQPTHCRKKLLAPCELACGKKFQALNRKLVPTLARGNKDVEKNLIIEFNINSLEMSWLGGTSAVIKSKVLEKSRVGGNLQCHPC